MQHAADPSKHTHDAHGVTATGSQRPYEAPAVVEDLPLETYSLACLKADTSCDISGVNIQS